MRLLTVTCVVAAMGVAVPAQSEDRDPEAEALAREAQQVVEGYCSDAVADDVTLAAESVATVSAVWARVSASLESNQKVYLLYWRGVLGQCLDQEDKALADLKGFLDTHGDSSTWASLVTDAERRVRQLERRTTGGAVPRGPVAPVVVGGIGAGVAGGLLGGLGGWQWSVADQSRQDLYDGVHIGQSDLQSRLDTEGAASAAHRGLVVGAGVAGATSVGLLVTAGILGQRAPLVAVAPWVLPVDVRGSGGAVGIVVGGGW